MKPLKLAPTISTPELSEIPKRQDILDMMRKRETANIVEGYTFKINLSPDFQHRFSAEINVDNDRLWDVFKALVMQFPNEAALIYKRIDDEPSYGNYVDKYGLMNVLEQYTIELTQDGFLEFGIIHNTEDFLEEVFVKKQKYLQYWGMDEDIFRQIMAEYDLFQIDNLNFIDEFPLRTTVLTSHYPDVIETNDLIQMFDDMFGINNEEE